MTEQLILHLEVSALGACTLRGMSGEARILVDRQGIIAEPPPRLARGDQLIGDRRHLNGGECRAHGTFEIQVLDDFDRGARLTERVATEAVVDDRGWRARRRGGRGAAAGPQHRKHADAQHHCQDTHHHIESIHPSVSPRQGSSSSGSSSDRSPPPMASSTMRRLSATSGVSYVLRTS